MAGRMHRWRSCRPTLLARPQEKGLFIEMDGLGKKKPQQMPRFFLNVLGYIVTTRIRREDHAIKTEQ
jgi:hypothetical protein